MKYRITVIAGCGFYADGSIIHSGYLAHAKASIREYACDRFGGITIRHHDGSWKGADNVLTEDGLTFEVLVADYFIDNPDVSEDRRLSAVREHANAFAVFIRSALQQKSVVLTIDKPAFAAFVE